MAELQDVLARPKFDRYVSPKDRATLLDLLIDEATLIPLAVTVDACRGPKDNHILELAVSGRATAIITGDADLLALDPFRGIPVLTPDVYLASLTTDPPA